MSQEQPSAVGPVRDRQRRGRLGRGIVREARSWPTLLLVLFCVLVGIPFTILVTPDQEVVVAGQPVSVGARPPDLSLSGPAQLVQIGNTRLDITPLRVYGPIRPRLNLGPIHRAAAESILDPVNGHQARAAAVSTLAGAFVHWYAWATLILTGFVLATAGAAGCVRLLLTLRRHTREEHRQVTVIELWHRGSGQIRGMVIVSLVTTLLLWGVAGILSYTGAVRGLQHVKSLADLVGTYHLSPSPVGPKVEGYTGAVIGDSRAARLGGAAPPGASDEDRACRRSVDSLATETGAQLGTRVLNLACSGASIATGLLGPQQAGDILVPPQIGRLKQVDGLKFVAVMIGPNDLDWADFLRYCYGVATCLDNLTQGEFSYRLADFDREYGDLLADLNQLPGRPQVIIVTSYDVFPPDASCADARGPASVNGLTPADIRLLSDRNAQLNALLSAGAAKYHYDVAWPKLTPLCATNPDKLGPDIQGLDGPNPFHPTGVGMVRIASSVVRVVKPDTGK